MLLRLASTTGHLTHSAEGVAAAMTYAAGGNGLDPTSALTIYGPIGIIAVLMMVGWLVPKYAYDRVVAENDRLKTLVEATTPLIAKNSEVTAEAIALIHLLQSQMAQDQQQRPRRPNR